MARNLVWVSPNGRQLYGIPPGDVISLDRLFNTLHPDDCEVIPGLVMRSLESDGAFHAEYRVLLPGGEVRWIGGRGQAKFNSQRKPQWIRGVSIDITDRKAIESEAAQHRSELAHLTRVNTLSEWNVFLRPMSAEIRKK